MNERFTYLVEKFLDNNLEGSEITEFKKYLALQENREYLRNAEIINRVIEEEFLNMLSEEEINKILGLKDGEDLE